MVHNIFIQIRSKKFALVMSLQNCKIARNSGLRLSCLRNFVSISSIAKAVIALFEVSTFTFCSYLETLKINIFSHECCKLIVPDKLFSYTNVTITVIFNKRYHTFRYHQNLIFSYQFINSFQ